MKINCLSFFPVSVILLLFVLLQTDQIAYAQEQQAHVHGMAELFVVFDGDQLGIELHSPAMNLLGFEHQANTAKQHALVSVAQTKMAKPDRLFQFQASSCRLIQYETDFSSVTGDPAQDENAGEHQEHGVHHEDNHDHSNIEAHYRFQCKSPKELHVMSIAIFKVFPLVNSLQAQWIINGRQGSATLDKQQYQIPFR